MSKVILTSCSFFPGSRSFSHRKSAVKSLSRNFWLRTDNLAKVPKCFILSHDSVFKYIPSGHGDMPRHWIEMYVSQVIFNVSIGTKEITWQNSSDCGCSPNSVNLVLVFCRFFN